MMKRTKSLVVVILSIFSIVFGIVNIAYAQAPDMDPFGIIKIKNPDAFIADIGKLIDKIEPGMGAMASGMMLGQMQMILKNPEWIGMDKEGEYMIVVLNPMMNPQPYALVVPVTNKDDYLNTLSQSLTGGEEVDGIYTFMDPSQKEMFVAFAGNSGILAEDSMVAGQVKALVEENNPLLAEVPIVKGQIAALISFNKIMTALSPMIEMFKEQALMGMEESMPQAEGAPVQPEAIKNIVQAEINILLSILNQIDKIQLGIDIQSEEIRLSKAVFAIEESNVAQFMTAQSPQKSALLGIIPADNALLGSTSLTFTPKFKEWYVWVTKAITGATPGADPAMTDQMAQWVAEALDAFTGEIAFGGLSQTEDTLITEVLTLKDTVKAKQLVEQYPQMVASAAEMYKSMGLGLDMKLTGTEEYKGGEILTLDFGLDLTSIPDPAANEAFSKLFGETLAMPIGFIGNSCVVGLGKDARGQVQKLMEVLDSGADVAAKYTPVMFGLPEENNFFMYLSVPKIMTWASKNFPEVPAFEIQEGPGIAMSTRFVESYVEGQLVIPVKEIITIKGMVEQAQMQEGAIQPTVE